MWTAPPAIPRENHDASHDHHHGRDRLRNRYGVEQVSQEAKN
jgi:hypothetical protein